MTGQWIANRLKMKARVVFLLSPVSTGRSDRRSSEEQGLAHAVVGRFCLSHAVLGRTLVKSLVCTNDPFHQADSRVLLPWTGFAEA